jgi:hypothetical protein
MLSKTNWKHPYIFKNVEIESLIIVVNRIFSSYFQCHLVFLLGHVPYYLIAIGVPTEEVYSWMLLLVHNLFMFHVFSKKTSPCSFWSQMMPHTLHHLVSELEYSTSAALSWFHHANLHLEVVLFIFIRPANFSFILNSLQSRKPRLTALGICCADHATPSIC